MTIIRSFFPALLMLLAGVAVSAQSPSIPAAIYTDPPSDPEHPARMEVLHIPSGGVAINGVAYLAAGAGAKPTLVICHGWPGNEKNLDLAQAVRRAGRNAVTFNYRGSWGSPGSFRFANNPEDARAVLTFLRDPARAKALGIDPDRIAIAGHSMGGWVAALVGGSDDRLLGTALISAANMGWVGKMPRQQAIKEAAGNAETLADTSPELMADELAGNVAAFDILQAASGLAKRPLLALTSNDSLAPHTDSLVAAVRAQGGASVTSAHVATDHGWSDRRIELQARIIRWLGTLAPPAPRR